MCPSLTQKLFPVDNNLQMKMETHWGNKVLLRLSPAADSQQLGLSVACFLTRDRIGVDPYGTGNGGGEEEVREELRGQKGCVLWGRMKVLRRWRWAGGQALGTAWTLALAYPCEALTTAYLFPDHISFLGIYGHPA